MNKKYFVAIVFFLHFKLHLLACSMHIDGPKKHLQKSALYTQKVQKEKVNKKSIKHYKNNTLKH